MSFELLLWVVIFFSDLRVTVECLYFVYSNLIRVSLAESCVSPFLLSQFSFSGSIVTEFWVWCCESWFCSVLYAEFICLVLAELCRFRLCFCPGFEFRFESWSWVAALSSLLGCSLFFGFLFRLFPSLYFSVLRFFCSVIACCWFFVELQYLGSRWMFD